MNVINVDGMYKAARITGPKHNFLGLALDDDQTRPIAVEKLLPSGASEQQTVSQEMIIEWVQDAIDKFNRECGAHWHVAKLQYVPSDTPSREAYEYLVKAIAEQATRDSRRHTSEAARH